MNKPIAIDGIKPLALVPRASLASAVAMAAMTVERKNTIPILGNLMIQGGDGSVRIVGTDLDNEISIKVPGAVDERFATTLPAHMLKDILTKAKATDSVKLSSPTDPEDMRCNVTLGAVDYKLQMLPAEDFPDLRGPSPTREVTTNDAVGRQITKTEAQPYFTYTMIASDLAYALEKVRFAISTEETRYYLNGIYIHYLNGALWFVATDGHRLGCFTAMADGVNAAMPGVILPSRTIGLLLKILPKLKDAAVKVEISGSTPQMMRFTMGDVVLTCKTIDGTYPDYARVVPRQNGKRATVNVKALDEAITQVTLIQQEKGRAVRYEFGRDKCRLTAISPDYGNATTEVACGYGGSEIAIGFNSRYVQDMLAEITGPDMAMEMSEPTAPALCRDPADERFLGVLVPMRV